MSPSDRHGKIAGTTIAAVLAVVGVYFLVYVACTEAGWIRIHQMFGSLAGETFDVTGHAALRFIFAPLTAIRIACGSSDITLLMQEF